MIEILANVPKKLNDLLTAVSELATRWTQAHADKLASLNTLVPPPLASSEMVDTSVYLTGSVSTVGALSNVTTSSSFVDAVNVTGSGQLFLLVLVTGTSSSTRTIYLEVIVDGVTVYSVSTLSVSGTANYLPLVGAPVQIDFGTPASYSIIDGMPLTFHTSLQIRHRVSSSGGANSTVRYKYIRFS